MEKEFIPYEQALALKELGFDEECLSAFFEGKIKRCDYVKNSKSDYLSAPLYQQAFRWFMEEYSLNSLINVNIKSYDWYFNIFDISENDVIGDTINFETYEEAQLKCLKKLIEIVKK